MNRSFASAIGALVAGLLALQFGEGWLATTLSLLAGGIVGWVGYDIRGLALGVARAFREIFISITEMIVDLWDEYSILRMDRVYRIGERVGLWWALIIAPLSVIVLFDYGAKGLLMILWLLSFLAVCMGTLAILVSYGDEGKATKALAHHRLIYLKYANPISATFWILYGLSVLTKMATQELWSFIQLAFVYTHTNERKLCFVDAVLGGAVGIYFHQPLIGAAVGGVIGMLYSPFTRPVAEKLRDKFAAEKLALAEKK